jgi:hypothetical protein
MSQTFVSHDFLTKFLEEYREMPVLWQVRSADYSNTTKWDEAWDLLLQLTTEKIPEADFCFVKKNVDSIRSSFRKELRRIRDSKRSGLSVDDVYSQHCATWACFCSRQTKIFLGKAKAIWRKKLKMLICIHKKQQL